MRSRSVLNAVDFGGGRVERPHTGAANAGLTLRGEVERLKMSFHVQKSKRQRSHLNNQERSNTEYVV